MSKRQYYGALAVLAVSGLLGGALSNWLLCGGAAWAQDEGAAKQVRCESFVLVDDVGKTRAHMGLLNGDPVLELYDAMGERRAALGLEEGDPGLVLYASNGLGEVVLGHLAGDPVLACYDIADVVRVELRPVQDNPMPKLSGPAGRAVWQAP